MLAMGHLHHLLQLKSIDFEELVFNVLTS